MTDTARLSHLLKSRRACILINTFEEDYAVSLVREIALELPRTLYIWSASGGMQEGLLAESPAIPNTEDPLAALDKFGQFDKSPICVTLDLIDQFRRDRVMRSWRNLLGTFGKNGGQLVMIDHTDDVPAIVRELATSFDLSLPDAAEIEQLVLATLRGVHRESPIKIDIPKSRLADVVRNLCGLNRRQIEEIVTAVVAEDRRFTIADIGPILAEKRRRLQGAGLLEFVATPASMNEIGGLTRLKSWLAARERALTDEAARFGITPARGILLLGVQGAGKSLCAKAIATAWRRPLLRMDVGALYDRYVGESERRLRDALAQAERMAPLILWIDEIEKAFASAASRSTDGGLSQRMFGMLLTWMQEHCQPVFLVATANDIEALPPELLRKGRFDEIFFVDLPTPATRRDIFAIHLRKRRRDPANFDLDTLSAASEGYSGAEIEQAVIAGLHAAFNTPLPPSVPGAAPRTGVELNTQHVLAALRDSPPLSVTLAEKVADLREWATHRCIAAD